MDGTGTMRPSTGERVLDVLEALLEGCQLLDFDCRYIYVNEVVAAHARTSRDALIGRTMMECFPGIERTPMFEVLRRCMLDRRPARFENDFDFLDGTKGTFQLQMIPVPEGLCILSLDITDSKRQAAALARSQDQLRHAQKMEAVGRLAGGVAHDFNNLLSVILGYTGLMRGDLLPGDPLRGEIDEIHAAGQRAAALTRQLLAFSRHQVLELRVLDLNQTIATTDRMLRRLLGADIELMLLPGADLWRVRADAGQVEQVLLNLAVNARDAMPHGGRLTVETQNVELDADYARVHHGVRPGRYVLLAVTDSGIGMDSETQARIFEPFFTTKPSGVGTGLGLSTVFGIVQQLDGHIWVYSEPGAGAVFKVYLPKADGDVAAVSSARPPAQSYRGSETILLVEDDDSVRGVAKGILRRNGYLVLEAANGGEALLTCEQHPATIHLLLTDLVLPRMGGRLLAERVTAMREGVKVLFMSGYTDGGALQLGLLESNAAYLQKPLTPDSLARKVREVLDQSTSRALDP